MLDLQWEDEIVRDVPIEVSVVGSPANGYVVKGVPVSEPTVVRIRGPKRRCSGCSTRAPRRST